MLFCTARTRLTKNKDNHLISSCVVCTARTRLTRTKTTTWSVLVLLCTARACPIKNKDNHVISSCVVLHCQNTSYKNKDDHLIISCAAVHCQSMSYKQQRQPPDQFVCCCAQPELVSQRTKTTTWSVSVLFCIVRTRPIQQSQQFWSFFNYGSLTSADFSILFVSNWLIKLNSNKTVSYSLILAVTD